MAAADEDSAVPQPAPVMAAPLKAESASGRVATRSISPAKPRAYAGKKRKDAKAKRGRRVGPRPAPAAQTQAQPPQWVQQGGSAPGGDFEGRAAQVNDFTETQQDALSTFAIDVDTAAYSIARRTLNSNRMPTPSLVRVEEVVNYFKYDYAEPQSKDELFSIQADGTASPVHGNRHLLRVGIQAKNLTDLERKPTNLVFLVDTSGSMSSRDKLALTKKALSFAVDQLDDRVGLKTQFLQR